MERISGLTSQDFQGSTTLTCTVPGECAFYLTGGNMSTNINIGRGNDLGKAKYCDRNTGVITLGTGNVLLNDNLASTSWDVGVSIGNCHCVQSDTWSFGYGNKSYAPSDHAILGYHEMIGYDLRIGNVNNTVWTHNFMTLVGNSIWIDHENFQAGMGANDLGYATHNSNTSTVVGRNIHLNHRYSSNPGRNEVVSSWGGRFCMTDSGVFGRGNVVWYKTSDNPHTGVVAVHAPHACMTDTNTYSVYTATCPIPNDQLRGATNAFIFGGYNRLFADRGIIVGYNNTTDTYCAPLSTTGVTAVPVNCIATNNVMVSYDSYAYGRDNVNIGRNNVVAGDRNYVMGTDATVLGNYSVAIGTQARVLRTGQAVTRPTMNIMTGAHPNDYSVAIGPNVWAGARGSIALGNNACTDKGRDGVENSLAIGTTAFACAGNSVAIGAGAKVLDSSCLATNSIAIGANAVASRGIGNVVVGVNAYACCIYNDVPRGATIPAANKCDAYDTVIGPGARAMGPWQVSVGLNAWNCVLNHGGIAIGTDSRQTYDHGIAIGHDAQTLNGASYINTNGPSGAIAIGRSSRSGGGHGTIALGVWANAGGNRSIAMGVSANSVCSSVSIGDTTCSHCFGIAIGTNATQASKWTGITIGSFTNTQQEVIRRCFFDLSNDSLSVSRIFHSCFEYEFVWYWTGTVAQCRMWHLLRGIELVISNLPYTWNGATNDANFYSRQLHHRASYNTGGGHTPNAWDGRWGGSSSVDGTLFNNSCQYMSDWFTVGNNTSNLTLQVCTVFKTCGLGKYSY